MTKSKAQKLIVTGAALVLMGAGSAYAQETDYAADPGSQPGAGHQHPGHGHPGHGGGMRGRRAFRLGLCVGQKLAQEGINLPMPTPGQKPPKPDDATKQAMKAAIKECRQALHGPKPMDSEGE